MLASKNTLTTRQKAIFRAATWEAIQKRARAGLIDFACFVDRPAARWYRARHLGEIARRLEAVERGDLKRLIVTIPPRHWKSSLASEKFPAWWLGRHPEGSVILASYALSLSEKFSRSVRETVSANDRYRAVFPNVELRGDSARADDWSLKTAVRSSLRAVGVGGGITGHGGNLIVIDDPIADYESAQSETQREKLWEWYRQVLRTRAEPGAAIVLIQTRWHEDDLAGRLIAAEREGGGEHWDVLNLPALSDDGAALWPERFDVAELARIRDSVGDYAWRSLYQGAPATVEGNLIKSEWFRDAYFPALPIGATWKVRAWDCAWTEKQTQKHDPDYTATVKACVFNDDLWLGEPRLFRASLEKLPGEIMAAKMVEPQVRYGGGKAWVESSIARSMLAQGYKFEQYPEDKDKISRASAWIPRAEIGRVKLVGTPQEWAEFVAQWWSFPNGAHEDSVDAVSGCAEMLGLHFVARPREKELTGLAFAGALGHRP